MIFLWNPAVQIGKGPIINTGVDDELDELRSILADGKKNYLVTLQKKQKANEQEFRV